MTTEGQQFLEKWNKMFDAVHKNPERKGEVAGLLDEMVAEEVVMGAPPYRKPLTGKLKVVTILHIILDLIPDFEYKRQWVNGNDLALEFVGHLGGEPKFPIQGVDLIHIQNGKIDRIDVAIRPLPSLVELKKRVREKITPLLSQMPPSKL